MITYCNKLSSEHREILKNSVVGLGSSVTLLQNSLFEKKT